MSTSAVDLNVGAELANDYWEQSKSPLASLIFVAPMLVGYEAGAAWLVEGGMRSGAAAWLEQGFGQFGLVGAWLVPVATVAALLAWQHATGRNWKLSAYVPMLMAGEAAAMAAVLVIAAQTQMTLMSAGVAPPAAGLWRELTAGHALSHVVLYLGAGLYEEFLFRLALLPALAWGARHALGFGWSSAWFLAAIASSLCFATAHYVGPHGDVFMWQSYAVRLLAGGFFAALFVLRGFGIAAGSHAMYDIWVGCIA